MDRNVTKFLQKYENATIPAVPSVPYPPTYLLVLSTLFYTLIFTSGLFGNLTVIAVVMKCRSMRTIFNILFLNLCLADLLLLIITGPTAVIDIYAREVWYLGKTMCKLIPFLENVVGHASALTILAISVLRYRVAFNLSQQRRNSLVIFKMFAAIWITSIVSALPSLLITQYDTALLLDGTPVKVCTTPIYMLWHKMYIILITSVFFVFPLLTIIFLYARVCTRLLSYRKKQTELESTLIEIKKLKRQMIQIIVTVVMVFFICHTPYRAVVIWTLFEKTETLRNFGFEAYLTVLYFTRILLYANHAINPFVYNFVSREFRRAMIWIFCHKRRQKFKSCNELNPVNNKTLKNISIRRLDVINSADLPGYKQRKGLDIESRNHINDFLGLYENIILLQ